MVRVLNKLVVTHMAIIGLTACGRTYLMATAMFVRTKLLQKHLAYNVSLSYRLMHLLKNNAYINGNWVDANSKQTFPICNPADNSVIAYVPDMNIVDTQLAIDAAAKAFESFSKTTAKERSDLLRKWYNLMVEHCEDLAYILTKENGKSLAESRAEIKYGNSFVEWFAEEARRINGEVLQAPAANRELFLLKQPVGVAALITPWNFPHAMITRKVGAALATGCTCVVKPSEDTPLTALALAELAEQANFPAGIFNVLTTSITNSPAVDVNMAVNSAMASKFRNTGQTCVSANRFFVETDIFDEFVEKFVEKIKKEIKMGDGSKNDITHGPLIKKSQLDMVNSLVKEAVQKGAKVHCGGNLLPHLGPLFYAPTVLTGVTKDTQIYNKEIFGPIAVINKFNSEEDVLEQANDTPVGLAGYFFSQDTSQIFRVARKLEVGMVGVNEGLISCAEAAFGGIKESGLGREGSKHGVEDFLDIKYVCIGNLQC
ncbi:uncharacterized protein LOC105186718 isoform X2 [Harpegnathos saltator]|uniref:uncharacterized protein LOC105186718 isoform X2 n=1 Tax=Harpegnathos saltator TaxID=610380 RepID=UPI000DBED09F|nr:uncharacterized protein LOC105186718 isoform X2 [Harpegnathos saltator]